jgi:hypothetical protein
MERVGVTDIGINQLIIREDSINILLLDGGLHLSEDILVKAIHQWLVLYRQKLGRNRRLMKRAFLFGKLLKGILQSREAFLLIFISEVTH